MTRAARLGEDRHAVRALLLDLDNTLLDRDTAFDAWLGALGVTSRQREEAIARDRGGHGDRGALFAWLGAELGVAPARIRARLRDELPALSRMRPEATALLETFAGPKIVVTDGDPSVQRAKAAASGVVARVDAIVASRELGHAKPHPSVFRAALAHAGEAAHETLMVGDHPRRDVFGAQRVGLGAVLLRTRWFEVPTGVVAIASLGEVIA